MAVLPQTSPLLSHVLSAECLGLAQALFPLFRNMVLVMETQKHRRGSPNCLGTPWESFLEEETAQQLVEGLIGTGQVEGRGARTWVERAMYARHKGMTQHRVREGEVACQAEVKSVCGEVSGGGRRRKRI